MGRQNDGIVKPAAAAAAWKGKEEEEKTAVCLIQLKPKFELKH